MTVVLGGYGTCVGVGLFLKQDNLVACWCLAWFVDMIQGGVDPIDGWGACHLRPEIREDGGC